MFGSRFGTAEMDVIDLREPNPVALPGFEAPVVVGRAEDAERQVAGLTAVVLLALLNVADIVLTHLLLDRGAVELNPIMSPMLPSNLALVLKLGIIAVLGYEFTKRRPRLITLCLVWLVTGVYVCVVIVNGTQLLAVWES